MHPSRPVELPIKGEATPLVQVLEQPPEVGVVRDLEEVQVFHVVQVCTELRCVGGGSNVTLVSL